MVCVESLFFPTDLRSCNLQKETFSPPVLAGRDFSK